MWQRELCRECEARRCQGAETQEPATLFKEMLVGGGGGGGWEGCYLLLCFSSVSLTQLDASLLPFLIKNGGDFFSLAGLRFVWPTEAARDATAPRRHIGESHVRTQFSVGLCVEEPCGILLSHSFIHVTCSNSVSSSDPTKSSPVSERSTHLIHPVHLQGLLDSATSFREASGKNW